MPCSALRYLALTSGALLALRHVAAAPEPSPKVFGLDFTKQVPRNTPESYRLRKRQKTVSVDISNEDIAYVINITVGTPPQSFSVQLDTGSSDLWILSDQSDACQQSPDVCQQLGEFDDTKSSTFVDIAEGAFQIQYEDNSQVSGDYFNDTLAIGKTTISNMTMGLALQSPDRAFGIMGIGYDSDESIAEQSPNDIYPNIIAQLVNQGYINTLAYSLWLNDLNSNTGSILFGGVDTDKFHGDLVVLPIQPSSNSSYTDFTVALSSVSFIDATGKTPLSQNNLALPVILDSGTTITYVPDSTLDPITSGIGAINSDELGGYVVPCSLSCSPATLNFGFGGNGGPSIAVSFAELVSPIYLDDGSQPTLRGETVCSFGMASGGQGPFLFGDTFLRSAYVVYDLTNNQIGIAQTNYNATSSNIVEISGSSIPGASSTASGAAVTQTYMGHPQETLPATKKAGSQATGSFPSPTFSLGSCATSASKNSGGSTGKSSAVGVVPPRIDAMTAVTGLVCLVSMIFGGSLVFMM